MVELENGYLVLFVCDVCVVFGSLFDLLMSLFVKCFLALCKL